MKPQSPSPKMNSVAVIRGRGGERSGKETPASHFSVFYEFCRLALSSACFSHLLDQHKPGSE